MRIHNIALSLLLGSSLLAFSPPVRAQEVDVVVDTNPFYFEGHRWCWYDDGWKGPGWYWCNYNWREGLIIAFGGLVFHGHAGRHGDIDRHENHNGRIEEHRDIDRGSRIGAPHEFKQQQTPRHEMRTAPRASAPHFNGGGHMGGGGHGMGGGGPHGGGGGHGGKH